MKNILRWNNITKIIVDFWEINKNAYNKLISIFNIRYLLTLRLSLTIEMSKLNINNSIKSNGIRNFRLSPQSLNIIFYLNI